LFNRRLVQSLLLLGAGLMAAPAQTPAGTVSGSVFDAQTGRAVAGAKISVNGQGRDQDVTDSDGKFVLHLSPGTYTIGFTAPNYAAVDLIDIAVTAGQVTEASTVMSSKHVVTTVNVTEKVGAVAATAAALLNERKLAPVVSDSIGRQELTADTSSDAAGALQKVTGISVVGGGFVYVRGLGERYSATELNGSVVPTTEPEKRVVPLDLFPTGLIDNIKIAKTYSPDLPAEFSGGLVQLQTIEFPTQKMFNLSIKSGFNTMTTFNPFLTYPGSNGDFFGYGAGERGLPSIIPRGARVFPGSYSPAQLQTLGRAFSDNWQPTQVGAERPQFDWSAAGGGTFGRFGLVGAVSFSNKPQVQNEVQRYLREGAGVPIVFTDYPDYHEYTETARVGAVFNAAIRLTPNQKLIFRNTYTHDSDKSAREFAGFDGTVDNNTEVERLRYIERSLFATSVEGDHSVPDWHNSLFHWQFTYSKSGRDEPDLREVFRNLLPDGRYIFAGTSTSGLRFFSTLNDHIYEPQLDYSIPFFKGIFTGVFKTGFRATIRRRNFEARRFLFQPQRQTTLPLFAPSNELFAADNIRPDGFQLVEYTRATDTYDALMNIYAGYAMVDLGLGPKWRLEGGIRFEAADQIVTTADNLVASATPVQAELQNTDPVPAINAIYAITPHQNFRVSYSRTLSRPDFRELSPFDFANTLGGFIVAGNPALKRAVINNYDARWEWFSGGDQLVAASLFAKTFNNPIEQIVVPSNDLRQTFVNAKGAVNLGVELELRRSLGSFWRKLRDFGVSSNFTFVDSNVDINPEDAAILTSQSRPLLGQSRYIFNTILEWRRAKLRSDARFSANYTSRRLSDVGTFKLPDIYEEGNTFLDFSYTYTLGEKGRWNARFEGEDLSNNDYRWTQGSIIQRDYHLGRTFSIGLSYSFF
jgi:outer membrane receptor protein involved in Fe transport